MRKLAIVLTLVLCLAMLGTAQMQAAVDPTLLDYVTKAAQATRGVTAVHVETQRQTQVGAQGSGSTSQGTGSFDLVATSNGWNFQGKQTTEAARQGNQITTTTQIVELDGHTYLNIQGSFPAGGFGGGRGAQATQEAGSGGQGTPAANGQGGGFGGQIPQGWFEVQPSQNGQPGGAFARGISAVEALGALSLPIATDSVTAISELKGDTIDGQAMRVIQVTLDSQAVLNSDAAALVRANLGGGFGGFGGRGRNGQGNGTPQASPATPAPNQTRQPFGGFQLNPQDVQVTFAVYVGQTDGYIHRIYSVINVNMTAQDGTTTPISETAITNYSAFGTPATITAPTLNS